MKCSNCGSDSEQGQYCRQCGSRLVDTEAHTVPITEPTNQAPMDKNDILIAIRQHLRQQGSRTFVITYAEVDRECHLPPGSTEQHIGQAVQETNIEIISKGSTRAELR